MQNKPRFYLYYDIIDEKICKFSKELPANKFSRNFNNAYFTFLMICCLQKIPFFTVKRLKSVRRKEKYEIKSLYSLRKFL